MSNLPMMRTRGYHDCLPSFPTPMTNKSDFETIKTLAQQDNVLELARQVDLVRQYANETDINGRGLLHAAVHNKAGDALQWLLDQGHSNVDLADVQGETPLMRAAWLGYKPAVEMLLEAGASLDAVSITGGTPLHFAYAGGAQAQSVVEVLLGAGATPDVSDKSGNLPSSWASQAKAREQGEQLLARAPARGKLSMTRKGA